MKVYQSPFIDKQEFLGLAQANPQLFQKMLNNRFVVDATGPSVTHKRQLNEVNNWIVENCKHLIFRESFFNEMTSTDYRMRFMFADDNEIVHFKLRFIDSSG